jgi:hypothetical protein
MGANGSGVRQGALQALTAAAMALPGLMHAGISPAQDNAASFQAGLYREGNRELYGVTSKFQPLQADSLQSSAWFAVTDRLATLLNFRQDTWSGATPIATAPREWRTNRSRAPDGVSGASPYLVPAGDLYLDKKTLKPLKTDGFGNLAGGTDTQLVHTMAGASRETRRQVDFNARRNGNESSYDVLGGVSSEPDYLSRFVGTGGRWDYNQKLTTVDANLAYTWSDTRATLDHDATPYIYNACGTASCNFNSASSSIDVQPNGAKVLNGRRHDWAAAVGLTQILSANAQVNTNLGYTRSQGYLSNPYKVVEVAFIDPEQQALSPSPDALYVTVNALLDKRPDLRNQWLWNLRYAQYIEATGAGMHVNYAYFNDDWGVRANTLELQWAQPFGSGWMATPMLRYYTQTAANFYVPYLVTKQAQSTTKVDPVTGKLIVMPFDASQLPEFYSSDYRLSAFGAFTGGLTLRKQFDRGVTAYLGYEYYRHAGNLKWGGGGEGAYSDFNAWLLNASLTFDLESAARSGGGNAHAGHGGGHSESEPVVPAGVMFAGTMPAGAWMAGYRFVGSRQAGGMRRGRQPASDADVKADGCAGTPCALTPTSMDTTMQMLELMYAPTDGLTLMVMPQYMNMSMSMSGLLDNAGVAALPPASRALYQHHTLHDQTSGGMGDTGIYALISLVERPGAQLTASLGVTAPTGDVGVTLRDTHQIEAGFTHYGMQLGSGTWDLNPSLTYLGMDGAWSWGGQLTGTVRLENRNRSGYALGNVFQASAWAGYALADGWTASLRGVWTQQGAIRGAYDGTFHPLSPMDFPGNYGGRYADLGIGLNYAARGSFAGNRLGFEWMLPVHDDVNGYQLARRGTINATWQYMF